MLLSSVTCLVVILLSPHQAHLASRLGSHALSVWLGASLVSVVLSTNKSALIRFLLLLLVVNVAIAMFFFLSISVMEMGLDHIFEQQSIWINPKDLSLGHVDQTSGAEQDCFSDRALLIRGLQPFFESLSNIRDLGSARKRVSLMSVPFATGCSGLDFWALMRLIWIVSRQVLLFLSERWMLICVVVSCFAEIWALLWFCHPRLMAGLLA